MTIAFAGRLASRAYISAAACGRRSRRGRAARRVLESGIIFGLSAALHGEITIKEGRVEQANADYRVMRMHEAPRIKVNLVAQQQRAA